jgi:hypothetical protein
LRHVIPDKHDKDQILILTEEDNPVLQHSFKTLPTDIASGKDALNARVYIEERDGVPELSACNAQGNWVYRELASSSITHGEGTAVNRRYLSQVFIWCT